MEKLSIFDPDYTVITTTEFFEERKSQPTCGRNKRKKIRVF